MPRDFTRGNIGVRIYDRDCTVIEKRSGVHGWVECGQRFLLPLPDLFDTNIATIPANELAAAVKVYEVDNPGGELRKLLTARPTKES